MKNALLALISSLLTFVLGAQVFYALPTDIRRRAVPAAVMNLHPYQKLDTSCPSHWVLRPGYDDGDVVVSKDGYRNGPERPQEPDIAALGDSCTFGIGRGYTGSLRANTGLTVVNAGVEGYSTRNLLCRLEEFKALKPRITIIYIGWNDLYMDGPAPSQIGAVRLLARVWQFGWQRWGSSETYFAPQDVRYDPGKIVKSVEYLALSMEKASSEVYVVTLPGLFRTDQRPSDWALEIGHTPYFTHNAYVLAAMAEAYNEALRETFPRGHILDAERGFPWREENFIDSVHLTPEAQTLLGRWMGVWINRAEEMRF